MEFTSLSDALISLIPIYGPWIIFGIVALESAGVPLPGETILVAAALLAATTGQINIVVVVLAAAAGAIVGDGMGYMVADRSISFLSVWERRRVLWAFHCSATNVCGFACGRQLHADRSFFLLQYNWWSLLGVSLRLRCLCSGRRNLQDFRNTECDLIGPVYCGGICTLNFHSTK
jgi:membrane protein YqaA with SNARE-associated domain